MFSHEIKRRRGTTSEHELFKGSIGEITVDTDKKTLVVHDGITYGGNPLATHNEMLTFIGKDYFIKYDDLNNDVKARLNKVIDKDYVDENFRKIIDKILFSDLDQPIKEQLILVSTLEMQLERLKEDLLSSEEGKGASLIGMTPIDDHFSENVTTVFDALKELSIRLTNQNDSVVSNMNEVIQINNQIRLILDKFDNYYTKDQVDQKFADYIGSSSDILKLLEELSSLIKDGSISDIIEAISNVKPIMGKGIFNSLEGTTIQHNLNSYQYKVNVTVTSNPEGKLGEYWVEKDLDSFTVYCSGSTTTTKFDYTIHKG